MELFCKFLKFGCYTCTVTEAVITQPSTEITSILGEHQSGQNNADVKVLQFENAVVNFFPRGLSAIFPNLDELHIENCGLKEISREDLIGFEKLEYLYLNENDLISLPDNLFVNMPNLKKISFENNDIRFMSSKLLEPVMNNGICHLDFEKNTRINAFFDRGCAESVESVAVLMEMIDTQCFKPTDSRTHESFHAETKQKLSNSWCASFKGYERLWSTGEFSDFLIINGSKQFRVHKCVLATQSVSFAEMFKNDTDATEMKIEDLSAEAVEEFLRFFYTGKLTEKTEHATEIFALAAKLKVPEVQNATVKMISSELNESNAYKMFALGHSHQSDGLKSAAFDIIEQMFPERVLPDEMIDDLQAVKKLVELKEKMDALVQKVSRLSSNKSS